MSTKRIEIANKLLVDFPSGRATQTELMEWAVANGYSKYAPSFVWKSEYRVDRGIFRIPTETEIKTGTLNGVCIHERKSGILLNDDFIGTSRDEYDQNECTLCFDNTTSHYVAFECGHGCCYDCATKIVNKRMPCPYCRKHFTTMKKGKYGMNIV